MEDEPVKAVTLNQDPVSFLADIREESPDILSILTTEQVKLLSQCPTNPYTPGKVDQDYLSDAWNHQCIRVMWRDSKLYLTDFLLEAKDSTKAFSTQDLETYERKKSSLEKVRYQQRVEYVQ